MACYYGAGWTFFTICVHPPKVSDRHLTVDLGINWKKVQLSSKGHVPMFKMCRTHKISHGNSRRVISSRLAQCHLKIFKQNQMLPTTEIAAVY